MRRKFFDHLLLLLETLENRINIVESIVDLLPHLGTGQDHFAGHENQQHNARLYHTIDQTGKQFRLVRTELAVQQNETLQSNRELDVTTADHILDFEVEEFCLYFEEEPGLLNIFDLLQ